MYLSRVAGVSILSVMLCIGVSTIAFSIESAVYDKPDVQQPGRTIHGKVIKVVKGDAAKHKWDVPVENGER